MATMQVGGAHFFGTKRHFISADATLFALNTPSGDPYTNGVVSNNINTAEVKITVCLPTGSTNDLHSSPPALTLTKALSGSNLYRLALWGEGAANGHDVCLSIPGVYGLAVYPVATEFNPIFGQYEVRADWDVQAVFTYVPGPAGSDQVSGMISFHRWWNRAHLDFPLTATGAANGRTSKIGSLQVKIMDASVTLLTLNQSAGDFIEGPDGNVYFTKPITGVTGARSLTGRVTGTYSTAAAVALDTFHKDFPLEAPFAA